eukprot:10509878-Lingulodinium_polyedra.AAC.1
MPQVGHHTASIPAGRTGGAAMPDTETRSQQAACSCAVQRGARWVTQGSMGSSCSGRDQPSARAPVR